MNFVELSKLKWFDFRVKIISRVENKQKKEKENRKLILPQLGGQQLTVARTSPNPVRPKLIRRAELAQPNNSSHSNAWVSLRSAGPHLSVSWWVSLQNGGGQGEWMGSWTYQRTIPNSHFDTFEPSLFIH